MTDFRRPGTSREQIEAATRKAHAAAEQSISPPPLDLGMEERHIRRLVERASWAKAVVVAVIGAAAWFFNLGRSEAEYAKKTDLAAQYAANEARYEAFRREQQSQSERLTRVEEQSKAIKDDTRFMRERLDLRK